MKTFFMSMKATFMSVKATPIYMKTTLISMKTTLFSVKSTSSQWTLPWLAHREHSSPSQISVSTCVTAWSWRLSAVSASRRWAVSKIINMNQIFNIKLKNSSSFFPYIDTFYLSSLYIYIYIGFKCHGLLLILTHSTCLHYIYRF